LIITVTPNPAWDVTYEVPVLVPGAVHRVTKVHRRLGGKGVNVARVLHATGHDAIAVLPGPPGVAAEAGPGAAAEATRGAAAGAAARPRLSWDVIPGLPLIRQTLVVHGADGVTTSLWEPGVEPDAGTDDALADRVRAWLHADGGAPAQGTPAQRTPAKGIAVSGSLPPGLDTRLPARLAALALDAGRPAVVDASGPALAHAATVPGVVLTPNSAELAELTGRDCHDPAAAIAAARTLLADGPRAIVVTLGEDGLAAVTPRGTWHGCLTERLSGNPTGAGDAAAAAIIAGLAAAVSWPEIVRDAVSTSAAAVLSPVAGEVTLANITRLRRQAVVREVT
jgi:tagatose 6-phosphate kinase